MGDYNLTYNNNKDDDMGKTFLARNMGKLRVIVTMALVFCSLYYQSVVEIVIENELDARVSHEEQTTWSSYLDEGIRTLSDSDVKVDPLTTSYLRSSLENASLTESADSSADEDKPEEEAPDYDAIAPSIVHNKINSTEEKPYFVFHVGPPKTATTSIQTDAYKLKGFLEEDNYYCGGRYYDPFFSEISNKMILNRIESDLVLMNHDMLNPKLTKEKAELYMMEPFLKELEKFAGKHILITDEALTYQWYRNKDAYKVLAQALSDKYHVVVVAGYRHFYEWAPSNVFQKQRLDRQAPWKSLWPGEEGTVIGKEGKGKLMMPFFPHHQHKRGALPLQAEESWMFTDNVVRGVDGVMEVRINNMNDRRVTPRENFFCNMLPSAPKTCEAAREMDRQPEQIVMNKREMVPHTFYDFLTTTAAEKGLLNPAKFDRENVRYHLRYHFEDILNKTVSDFELVCPSEKAVQEFFEASLDRLKLTFGKFTTDAMIEAHNKGFWEKANTTFFCDVDAEKSLELPDIKEFFENYESKHFKSLSKLNTRTSGGPAELDLEDEETAEFD